MAVVTDFYKYQEELMHNLFIYIPLMLVTHLIIGAKMSVGAAVHVVSILRLSQAIDCGGGLVNALGSRLPCRIKCLSLFLWPNLTGLFCYTTTGTSVRWNSVSGVIFVPPNSIYSSHRKGDH